MTSPSLPVRIFGREPAAIVATIEAVLALLVAFQLGLDAPHVALIMAVVTAAFGLYTAWVTHDTLLGVVVGFIKAVLALSIGYGLPLSPAQTAALIAVVTVGLGLFNRQQTFPSYSPPADVVPGTVVNSYTERVGKGSDG